jgi:hypothetical protein
VPYVAPLCPAGPHKGGDQAFISVSSNLQRRELYADKAAGVISSLVGEMSGPSTSSGPEGGATERCFSVNFKGVF